MKSIQLFLIVTTLLLSIYHCSSSPSTEIENERPKKTTTVMEESNESSGDEFIKATEGFLNADTFQVVVSSLEGNADGAQDLARKGLLIFSLQKKETSFVLLINRFSKS